MSDRRVGGRFIADAHLDAMAKQGLVRPVHWAWFTIPIIATMNKAKHTNDQVVFFLSGHMFAFSSYPDWI